MVGKKGNIIFFLFLTLFLQCQDVYPELMEDLQKLVASPMVTEGEFPSTFLKALSTSGVETKYEQTYVCTMYISELWETHKLSIWHHDSDYLVIFKPSSQSQKLWHYKIQLECIKNCWTAFYLLLEEKI